MRGKKGVRVFMTSPHGRMSPFQQAQMFSLQDENIHNIAIEGVFDDCQDIVKAVSATTWTSSASYKIGTVNSINWARLLAQVVYLLCRLLSGHRRTNEKVSFTVPSGNFGNVCAGHVARMMGLPIDKLVVATNENDVLDEFFRTGVYRVRGSADTHETSSPSMDISKASNFERFVFDLLGRDGARTKALFGDALTQWPLRPERRPALPTPPRATALSAARAPMPTAWPPSATPGPALWRDDRHPHRRRREGGARAPATRRAHDRAGDGAAHQVCRDHRRGPGPSRARSARPSSTASRPCPSACRSCRPTRGAVKRLIVEFVNKLALTLASSGHCLLSMYKYSGGVP
jgi:hypothetical protein